MMFLAFIAWAWVFSLFDVWHVAITDPVSLIIYIICYAVVGIIWTVPKWLWYVKDEVSSLDMNYLRDSYNERGYEKQYTFKKFLYGQKPYLRPENNKEMIFSWAILWPLSMTWEILHRHIRMVIDWLSIEWLRRIYNRINDHVLAKLGIGD